MRTVITISAFLLLVGGAAAQGKGKGNSADKQMYHVRYTDEQGKVKCHNGPSREQVERNAEHLRAKRGITNVVVAPGKCDRQGSATTAPPPVLIGDGPGDQGPAPMDKPAPTSKPNTTERERMPDTTGEKPTPTTTGKEPAPVKEPAPTTSGKEPPPPGKLPVPTTSDKEPAPAPTTSDKEPAPPVKPTAPITSGKEPPPPGKLPVPTTSEKQPAEPGTAPVPGPTKEKDKGGKKSKP